MRRNRYGKKSDFYLAAKACYLDMKLVRARVDSTLLEALAQLLTATWDGNLMSKDARDRLVKCGLAQRHLGYNWVTIKGVQYLVDFGALAP